MPKSKTTTKAPASLAEALRYLLEAARNELDTVFDALSTVEPGTPRHARLARLVATLVPVVANLEAKHLTALERAEAAAPDEVDELLD